MNTTQLHIQEQQLSLKRFPLNQFDKSLRAWDAADEYIIDHVATLDLKSFQHIVIVNDSFGALACAMSKLAPHTNISVFTDSYMAKCGIQQNLKGSNLDKNNVSIFSSLDIDTLAGIATDLVLVKIPRTLAFLEYSLIELNRVFAPHTDNDPTLNKAPVFVGGAMVKLVTSSVMSIFEETLSDTKTSLARKKARLIFSHFSPQKVMQSLPVNEVTDNELDFSLYNFPNVFCRDQVDIGARYMLKALPNISKTNQVVVDLGCGNGILGTSLLVNNKHNKNQARLIFVDESYMAIASAKATLFSSEAEDENKETAKFIVGHCLQDFFTSSIDGIENGVDTIICNPPFHQQNTVIDDIAWQMFSDARKILKPGGELRIVGNRHLDHQSKLSKLFGGCKVIATNDKFTILSAIKPL
jgi:16S rRNA (guanine1207-N2)-methyltransferase/23S rRNA (guanine1835-N2)-methyltransferase